MPTSTPFVMRRIGWGRRIVQGYRWRPSTHKQVWLYAVFGFGVPGFILTSVVIAQQHRLLGALIYAVVMTPAWWRRGD